MAEVVAGEGESVDEEPEKSGNPQWQGPGGEKVQGKVFNPDIDQCDQCGQINVMNVVKYLS